MDSILIYGSIGRMEEMRHLFAGGSYEVLETDALGGLYELIRKKAPHLLLMGLSGRGADDCISYTDCSPLELLARAKSRLRRYTRMSCEAESKEKIYRVHDLVINDISKRVFVGKQEIKLTPIEYEIVKLLVQEKGKVLSISQIYEAIWHMRPIGADNTIAVHIHHIREKLEENPKEPRYIKAVWGTGYKAG